MMKILVVDDNAIQRMVLEYNLKKRNYQVEVVTSGQEALQMMEQQADIDLVISDIMMPQVDGLELLRRLKADPRLSSIPVILCTALSDSKSVQQAAQLGCRYYLLKPIQVPLMLEKVQEALQDRKRVLRDFKESQVKLGMDPPAFHALMVDFEKSVQEKIVLVQQTVENSNLESIRGDLATLYENSVLLGAERLARVLADIQSVGDLTMTAREDCLSLLQEMQVLSTSLAKKIAEHRPKTA